MSLLAVTSGDIASGVVEAEGVDFDGVTDYLSRSTDLVGNVDSKTFTFSCWIYNKSSQFPILDFGSGVSPRVTFYSKSTGGFYFACRNSVGTAILDASVGNLPISLNSFVHVLISIDLSNTSNRRVYINDKLITTTYSTYTNDLIDFTNAVITINNENSSASGRGRLSNVFLDYTYRDLSIEANRRLFITADGKPTPTATLKALNPILYLPMKDAATAHINEGTGGNFVQNGTLDTASRGANQDNCVASYFDGTADYLSRTSLTGIADGKVFTISFTINKKTLANGTILSIGDGTSSKFDVYVSYSGSFFQIIVIGYDPTGVRNVWIFSPLNMGLNKTYHISISFDLTNTSSRYFIINGVQVAPTYQTYLNGIVDVTSTKYTIFKSSTDAGTSYVDANIGELYFDTRYTDLATSNPFWDADTNRPKPVRQVIAETGVVPLIAMPLDASNAGKNYGTGGDFTANSAPYVGARGGSEYWQRTAKFDGSTAYLSKTGLDGITDSKYLTFVANVYKTASTLYHLAGTTNSSVSISINASNQLVITAKNAGGTTILSATVTTTIANNTWTEIMVSLDLSNSANRSAYLNGALATVTWTTYTNDLIDFTVDGINVGADISNGNKFNGSMFLMLDNTYIDFSSEVNRLKYYDGLGYPKDLSLLINKPALLLNFNDVSNLGLNSGYGGNMTLNGALVSGSDVLG